MLVDHVVRHLPPQEVHDVVHAVALARPTEVDAGALHIGRIHVPAAGRHSGAQDVLLLRVTVHERPVPARWRLVRASGSPSPRQPCVDGRRSRPKPAPLEVVDVTVFVRVRHRVELQPAQLVEDPVGTSLEKATLFRPRRLPEGCMEPCEPPQRGPRLPAHHLAHLAVRPAGILLRQVLHKQYERLADLRRREEECARNSQTRRRQRAGQLAIRGDLDNEALQKAAVLRKVHSSALNVPLVLRPDALRDQGLGLPAAEV
mmetsp:Transcript_55291/g.160178  ORF Transcript_55291/g.160178 Transcript_55291/m.160178 type:complete len:259 (+) Transcript_55291:77-853(+)